MKIAVVSGKGGVGKTTLSLRIAEALASKYSVALFDADITGSNTHLMLSIEKDIRVVGDKLIPAIARINGRKVEYVSISLVSDNYIRWEGNVVDDFISQVMNSTEWSAEHIIIDCPPGTHEDTIRSIELADVVVFVTIPAKFAKLDLERTIDLVRDIGKPVAGVFVNFSKVVCPICGHEFRIFDSEVKYDVPVIQEIPVGNTTIDLDRFEKHLNNPVKLQKRSIKRKVKRSAVKMFLRAMAKRGG